MDETKIKVMVDQLNISFDIDNSSFFSFFMFFQFVPYHARSKRRGTKEGCMRNPDTDSWLVYLNFPNPWAKSSLASSSHVNSSLVSNK